MRLKLGRKSFFTPEGKVALMFLKMYTGLSCKKLLWEGVEKSYAMMCELSSRLGIHRPRTFIDVQKANGIQTSFVKRGRPFGDKKRRKTLSERNLQERWRLRWKASSGHRRSTTISGGSRPGRSGRKSFTSSSASTRQTWSSWRTG